MSDDDDDDDTARIALVMIMMIMMDNDTIRYCRGLQHLNIQDVAGVSLQGYRAVRAHCRR